METKRRSIIEKVVISAVTATVLAFSVGGVTLP